MRSGDCAKDYLSGAPPSVGAERTENFENRDLSDRRKWHFSRLVSRESSRYYELLFPIKLSFQ